MEKWFLDPKNGPTAEEVWGDKKQTYENLEKILRSYIKKKGKGGVDRKGKKRQDDPPSEPEEEETVKKKEKGKKVEGNKKGSSSKSRY
jgi:hypothetical protein